MKIVHVTQSLILNSGVSVFVCRMAGAMAKQGHDVSLRYNWGPDYPVDDKVDLKAYKSLSELTFRPDVVHIHSLWSLDMAMAMLWCRKHGIKYFVSPHGGLMPRVFSRGWLKKHLFYWLFLRRNLNSSSGIHCTGDGEVNAVRSLGIKARTFIVPLGCDLPDLTRDVKKEKIVLFLSRLGEEKGLLFLLDAWKRVHHNGWRLMLAGPNWEGYRRVLEKKIEGDKIADVEFYGAADENQKDALYRSARLFVLPSPMENFSMVVLDALAYGVPVICTKGCPWKVLQERKCGWWVDSNSAKAIENALSEALMMPHEDLQKMGERAISVASEFSWDSQAMELLSNYGR